MQGEFIIHEFALILCANCYNFEVNFKINVIFDLIFIQILKKIKLNYYKQGLFFNKF